jgi:agmatinase
VKQHSPEALTLAALERRLARAGENSLALLGLPSDANSCFLRGAAGAPPAIRKALHCEAGNLLSESGFDFGSSPIFDCGDLELPADAPAEPTIERALSLILESGRTPICLGGDHSITFPVISAFSAKYEILDLLQLDAHPDLYDEFEGNRTSNACPFARIMERGLARRLVQVGIRTATTHQREQVRRFGVEMIEMKDWSDASELAFDAPLYVSVDLDVLDPAYAPGVSHPEPGGLSTRELIGLIQNLDARLVGADIVELNPRRDATSLSATVCAKLLKEIAAKILGT